MTSSLLGIEKRGQMGEPMSPSGFERRHRISQCPQQRMGFLVSFCRTEIETDITTDFCDVLLRVVCVTWFKSGRSTTAHRQMATAGSSFRKLPSFCALELKREGEPRKLTKNPFFTLFAPAETVTALHLFKPIASKTTYCISAGDWDISARFLPLDDALAYRAVFVVVSGSHGRVGGGNTFVATQMIRKR